MTDVSTSAGVIIGVAAVAISGWERLDALVALAVAVNLVALGHARSDVRAMHHRTVATACRWVCPAISDRFEFDVTGALLQDVGGAF